MSAVMLSEVLFSFPCNGICCVVKSVYYRDGSRWEGAGGAHPPPPPRDDQRFSNTTGILQKKTMWFTGVEVERETSAPPPKNILDPPLYYTVVSREENWQKSKMKITVPQFILNACLLFFVHKL